MLLAEQIELGVRARGEEYSVGSSLDLVMGGGSEHVSRGSSSAVVLET